MRDNEQFRKNDPEKAKAVLSPTQVRRLQNVLVKNFEIHGSGNFPTLNIRLRDLFMEVRDQLAERRLTVRTTKINGGLASHILATSDSYTYSDLDLIFHVQFDSAQDDFDLIREAVFDSLLKFLPDGTNRDKMSRAALKDAYIRKMVKVDEAGDTWSLFSLNNHYGRYIELKFVDKMRRQFEFSVDSFQITVDPLLSTMGNEEDSESEEGIGSATITPALTPECKDSDVASSADLGFSEERANFLSCTDQAASPQPPLDTGDIATGELQVVVEAESMFGDFRAALRHLNQRLIDTRCPEEIRGGGLLKYCHLLIRGYTPARPWKYRQLERYMCSRFFIDFPDLGSQEMKLCSYLANHFSGEEHVKYEYLLMLYRIVSESTVCLMSHERRQSLEMIDRLAYQQSFILYQQQHNCNAACGHVPRQTLLFLPKNGTCWIPVI